MKGLFIFSVICMLIGFILRDLVGHYHTFGFLIVGGGITAWFSGAFYLTDIKRKK